MRFKVTLLLHYFNILTNLVDAYNLRVGGLARSEELQFWSKFRVWYEQQFTG
jgi:hypothetical protein